MGDAIAHSFDKDGPSSIFQSHPTGFSGHFVYGENVVAVDADGIDAVSDSPTGDSVAPVLFQGGCGDGIAVVATDEDHGA